MGEVGRCVVLEHRNSYKGMSPVLLCHKATVFRKALKTL